MIFKFFPINTNGNIGGKILYNSSLSIYNVKFKNFIEINQSKGKNFKDYLEFN